MLWSLRAFETLGESLAATTEPFWVSETRRISTVRRQRPKSRIIGVIALSGTKNVLKTMDIYIFSTSHSLQQRKWCLKFFFGWTKRRDGDPFRSWNFTENIEFMVLSVCIVSIFAENWKTGFGIYDCLMIYCDQDIEQR